MVYITSLPFNPSSEGRRFDSAHVKAQLPLEALRDQFEEVNLPLPSEEPSPDFVELFTAVVTLETQLRGAIDTCLHEDTRYIIGSYVTSCQRDTERLIRSLYAEDAQSLLEVHIEVLKEYLLLCLQEELEITESRGIAIYTFGDLQQRLSYLRYRDLCDLCNVESLIRDRTFRESLLDSAQQSIALELAAISTELPEGISPRDFTYDTFEEIIINAAIHFSRGLDKTHAEAVMSAAQSFSLPESIIQEVIDVSFLKIALKSCIYDATDSGVFQYALKNAIRDLEEMSDHQLLRETFHAHYAVMSRLGNLNGEEYPAKKVAESLAEILVDSAEAEFGENEEVIAKSLGNRKDTEFALSLWMTLAYNSSGEDQASERWQRAQQIIEEFTGDQQARIKEQLLDLIQADREERLRAEAEGEEFVMNQLRSMAANGSELSRLVRTVSEKQERPLSSRALALCDKLELVSKDLMSKVAEPGADLSESRVTLE